MNSNDTPIEDKRKFLLANGWHQLWSEDNWLEDDVIYADPDRAGMDTNSAYNLQKFRIEHWIKTGWKQNKEGKWEKF